MLLYLGRILANPNDCARGVGCSRLDGCGSKLRRTHQRSAAGPAFHHISSHFARQFRNIWVLIVAMLYQKIHQFYMNKFMRVVSKSYHHQASWHHTETFLSDDHVAQLT